MLNLVNVKDEYLDRLLRLANVTGVGIGTKVVDGEDTGEPCIKVFVSEKLPVAAINTEDRIPWILSSDGRDVKTDVEVAGPFEALWGPADHQKRIRPVLGGISTSRTAPGTGTICGYYFKDKRDGKIVGLSNNHVWAEAYQRNGTPPNVPVGLTHIQPGVADGGTQDEMFHIGKLKRYVPVKMTAIQGGAPKPELWNRVDMALSDPTVPYEQTALGLNDSRIQPKGYRRVDIPDVQKKTAIIHSGRSTNVSYGHPIAVNSSFWVGYGTGNYAFFTDCVVFAEDPPSEKFIAPGDSGSPVFIRATEEWAGLIFAGDNYSHGITCQPDNVLREGEIDFYIGEAPPWEPGKKYGPSSTSADYKVLEPTGTQEPSSIVGSLGGTEYEVDSTIIYSGRLLGRNDNQPLPGRQIDWEDKIKTSIFKRHTRGALNATITDTQGRFVITFKAEDPGNHELTVSFAGDP